jgi:GNAT superfamily N-acetyltransferase
VPIEYRPAPPELAAEYIKLRGLTRENPISENKLQALGITAESWARDILTGHTQGIIATSDGEMIGYCFAGLSSAEILVLAVHPKFEGQGVGRRLLEGVARLLERHGHEKLFLGCSPDSGVRSHGFYRHLGWRSTGTFDDHGDEILEFACP